jgi:hypothetical protein
MPYDPGLAHRLDDMLTGRLGFAPKAMFGGLGWMLNGNMCCGIHKDWLIVRVGEEAATVMLAEEHVAPMAITGMPMKGWVMVAPEGLADDEALRRFVDCAVAFVMTLPAKN